jgi:ribosomal protein S18 acetylase RimI-like enzyme
MQLDIKVYDISKINDVITFENKLREDEEWGWEINDDYISSVKNSFTDERFQNSISLLAYLGENVVGRIDASLIFSHFDGSVKAYLDWICVLKEYRHRGVAQSLISALKTELKRLNVDTLVGIIAQNEESLRFYKAIEGAKIQDQGIWITV